MELLRLDGSCLRHQAFLSGAPLFELSVLDSHHIPSALPCLQPKAAQSSGNITHLMTEHEKAISVCPLPREPLDAIRTDVDIWVGSSGLLHFAEAQG